MAFQPFSLQKPRLIVVEGNDELRLFNALTLHLAIENVQIHALGGIGNLNGFLRVFKASSDFDQLRALAVVVDADDSRQQREQKIHSGLSNIELVCPSEPLKGAQQGENPKCFYLILPHAEEQGMLEDVCLGSVKGDPALQCVDHYFACIDKAATLGPKSRRMSKARVHAFLASRPHPDLRLGEAAEKGIWDFDSEAFRPLRCLLKQLTETD